MSHALPFEATCASAGPRTEPRFELTDERWSLIEEYFRDPPASPAGGRPRASARACFEGILWVLRTGARWRDLPPHFPSPATCWRRHREWTTSGLWERAWSQLLRARASRRARPRAVVGRRHVLAREKRGGCVGKTKRGKGSKIMLLSHGCGVPWGADVTSASPHEITLIEPLLERRRLRRLPKRLIYDRATDGDPLRLRLKKRGVKLICPHRANRTKPPLQDGRALRRYRHRWKIERSIGWLQKFRRLVTRYEHYENLFLGFVQLACLVITIRRF